MGRPELLVTYPLLPQIMDRLAESYKVHRWYEIEDKEAFLAGTGQGIRAVFTGGHLGWPTAFIDRMPALEIIAVNGVGYDKVDLAKAGDRGIRVTNTPGLMADDVADLAVGMIIASFRQFVRADGYVRDGSWSVGEMPLGRKVSGRRIGIYGMGAIGSAVARRLAAFDCPIAYTSRTRRELAYRYYHSLTDLARESEVLVLAAAATPETRHAVDRDVLEALGPDGLLVNVARGALVDEEALAEALTTGRLGAAALDVFENEPDVNPSLLSSPRLLALPHIGAATGETRLAMGLLVIANLDAHFAGEPLRSAVV